jgi:predicted transcriptional regulator
MKTNKHQTLLLTRNKEAIRARDIVTQFSYSSGTARSYLSYLARHGLLERTVTGYVLTEKGKERLEYFEAVGCTSFDCPLCIEKKAGHYICQACGYEIPKKEARILPEKDGLFVKRLAGLFCPECDEMIFDEKKASLLGIPKEK